MVMKIQIGQTLTYYPPQNADDNLKFPVTVEAIGKRIKVRTMEIGSDSGVVRYVSAKRLRYQLDMFDVFPSGHD